jgi:hypothetical protein
MLIKVANANLIKGLYSNLYPRGVICLQYAYDTILFSASSPVYTTNLKWVLTCFEQVSGMRINYKKSEIIPLGLDETKTALFTDILGCDVGTFPIKYLGIPSHYTKLRREDIQPLRQNPKKDCWLEGKAPLLCS